MQYLNRKSFATTVTTCLDPSCPRISNSFIQLNCVTVELGVNTRTSVLAPLKFGIESRTIGIWTAEMRHILCLLSTREEPLLFISITLRASLKLMECGGIYVYLVWCLHVYSKYVSCSIFGDDPKVVVGCILTFFRKVLCQVFRHKYISVLSGVPCETYPSILEYK